MNFAKNDININHFQAFVNEMKNSLLNLTAIENTEDQLYI